MTTIEELAGVPSAAELALMANELFPDLTESVYGAPEPAAQIPAVPEVNAPAPGVQVPPPVYGAVPAHAWLPRIRRAVLPVLLLHRQLRPQPHHRVVPAGAFGPLPADHHADSALPVWTLV